MHEKPPVVAFLCVLIMYFSPSWSGVDRVSLSPPAGLQEQAEEDGTRQAGPHRRGFGSR